MTTRCFPVQKELTRDDVVVVMGDFGVCWDGGEQDRYIQSWHENKNYTTLAVAGNHENYDIISRLPIIEKWGGKVYQVTPHVFYTVTGEVYNICGYNCLAINGADSHDKDRRKEGRDWWAAETISRDAYYNALINGENCHNLDFLFTHTGGTFNMRHINLNFKQTPSDATLDEIMMKLKYKWKTHYFGHYHIDKWTGNKAHCLYNKVYEIIDGKECLQHGINYDMEV